MSNTILSKDVLCIIWAKLYTKHRDSKTKHKESTEPESVPFSLFPFSSLKEFFRKNKFNSKQSSGIVFL